MVLHFQMRVTKFLLTYSLIIHLNQILVRSFRLPILFRLKISSHLASPFTLVVTSSSCTSLKHLRKLPRLIATELPPAPTGSPSQPVALPLDVATRSIKSVLMANTQVVYERLFANSLPQHERTSYFLTEIYNVKDLIRHREFVEKGYEVSLQQNVVKENADTKEILKPYYTLKSDKDTTLIFESRFECGNLCLASKVSEWEYNLFMQNDVNTQGFTQWFYFQVSNTRARSSVKFNILNFVFIIVNL